MNTPVQVGKYLVSPTSCPMPGGRHAASVSIRSGRGSSTDGRLTRFEPLFDSPGEATRFATRQALDWIGQPALPDDTGTPRLGRGGHSRHSPRTRGLLQRTGTSWGIFFNAPSKE